MATMYYRPFTAEPLKDSPPNSGSSKKLPKYILPPLSPNRNDVPEDAIEGSNNACHEHREIIKRMGQEILSLQDHVAQLESENGRLRREIARYTDTGLLLKKADDSKTALEPDLTGYGALQHKYVELEKELISYKDRVQKLQNELIKKNDFEKRYIEMCGAHKSQNTMLQKLQDKAVRLRKMEDACRTQEKVIEKLEAMVKASKSSTKKIDVAVHEEVKEENRRLRAELDDCREHQMQQRSTENAEQIRAYRKVDVLQEKVASLEEQLEDSARLWDRERAELERKLELASTRRSPDPPYSHIKPRDRKWAGSVEPPRRFSKAPARRSKYASHDY